MFRLFRTVQYEKLFEELSKFEQERVIKFEKHLKIEPFSGKPLGFKFFREKKFEGRRLLFLVYEEYSVVFVISIVDKKVQQKVIDFTKKNFAVYREAIQKMIEEFKPS